MHFGQIYLPYLSCMAAILAEKNELFARHLIFIISFSNFYEGLYYAPDNCRFPNIKRDDLFFKTMQVNDRFVHLHKGNNKN